MKRKYGILLLICLLNISCVSNNTSETNSTKTVKVGQTSFSHTSLKINSWGEDEVLKNAIKSLKFWAAEKQHYMSTSLELMR